MAVHRTILSTLCRLCGSQNMRDFSSKEAMSRDINMIFEDIDISRDDSDIHPPNVCSPCRLKISRWKQARRKKGSHNLPLPNITLKEFLPHLADCEICEEKQWDKDVLLKVCEANGFYAWEREGGICAITVNMEGNCILKRMVIKNNKVLCYVLGKKIDETFSNPHDAMSHLIDNKICVGNEEFESLAKSRSVGFRGRDGQQISVVERSISSVDEEERLTIRHVQCKLLLTGRDAAANRPMEMCSVCSLYRSTLAALSLKQQKSSEGISSEHSKHKPTVQLTNPELQERVKQLTRENKNVVERNKRLCEKVRKVLIQESIELSHEDEKSVQEVVSFCKDEIEKALKDDSCCKLLWEQQLKAHSKKSKQMRWHPAILRWAIAIHSKSASAYDLIRKSGFLILPHANTLYQYTHFTDPTTGINPDLLNRFHKEFEMDKLEGHERLVSLMIDEMKVKSGLAFSKSSGRLIGFSDVGSINEEMQHFERKCMTDEEKDDRPLASHILLYMVRGITTSVKFPAAYYASVNVTGSQLYETTMEVIEAVKLLGLRVLCLISDGASSNRKMYEILGGRCDSVLNPPYYAADAFGSGRLYFICDPPHLLKTLRNNVENSNWNRKTRNLMFQGKKIEWTQLLQLFEWDQGKGKMTPGLRLLPKLTYEHLHLTPGLRMKVILAAQVLSNSVANALKVWNKQGMESTIVFIQKVNKFFDCLNVSSVTEGRKKRNVNLMPYTSVDDPRLQWLEQEFLGFLQEWVEEGAQQGHLTPKERTQLCISNATIIGCHITVRAFIDITKFLLNTEGVNFVLSDKFNQDPLEEFFGKQRAAGGHLDNPTVEQFGHSLMRNVVAGQCVPGPSRGSNVRSREMTKASILDEPLPKRPRQKLGISKEAPC